MDTPFPDLLQFIVACVLALGAITLAVVCVGASKTPIAGDHH